MKVILKQYMNKYNSYKTTLQTKNERINYKIIINKYIYLLFA